MALSESRIELPNINQISMKIKQLVLSFTLLAFSSPVFADNSRTPILPRSEVERFAEVMEIIRKNYFEEVNASVLFDKAIVGMLSGLDPHSDYLNEEANNDLAIRTKGRFGGLGIQVVLHESGLVEVISPIDDTPAFRAGIQSGDLISKLDDKAVKGLTLNEAVDIMRGDPGVPITLTVLRGTQTLTFNIVRDFIRVASVRSDYLGNKIAYLRIATFQQDTALELREQYDELLAEHGSLNGLILDLRNNPGGLLSAAVEVSDLFLDKGLRIVFTEGRNGGLPSRTEAAAVSDDHTDGLPVVVLINGGSASASEIVSGALQDHQRAVVVGTRSFGKGSVQSVLLLKSSANKAAVKVTTALYFTPSGRSIQAEGIEPDIKVQPARVENFEERRVSESSLSGHLKNANDGDFDAGLDSQEELQSTSERDRIAELLSNDFQLKEAVNMLRGAAILNQAQSAAR